MKYELTSLQMHQGVNLFIPRLGVTTGIDITPEGLGKTVGKHRTTGITRMVEKGNGSVDVFWIDKEHPKIEQKSAVSAAVIVSYGYTPVLLEETKAEAAKK